MAPTPAGDRLWRWGRWLDDPPREIAETVHIKVLQLNMCGSRCNEGGLGIADALARSIADRRPDVVLLNEACLNQVDSLQDKLRGRGLRMAGCFGASTGRTLCGGAEGERWYGNAVLAAGTGIGAPGRLELPNRPTAVERRNVTSMQAHVQGRLLFLSSPHLSPVTGADDYNSRQLTEVASLYNAKVEDGEAVVLGGDFNAELARLRQLYLPSGSFSEADDVRRAATYKRRKIDYIFFSYPDFTEISGKVTRSSYSDHRPLWGEATLRAR